MKKLMSAVLMLFILTMLVAGASAAPDRFNNVRYTTSVNEHTKAYATSNSETGNAVVSTNAYLSVGYDKNLYANGYTQTIASGGTGTTADSGQAITGTISTGPIN
jgi:hypothetical protein